MHKIGCFFICKLVIEIDVLLFKIFKTAFFFQFDCKYTKPPHSSASSKNWKLLWCQSIFNLKMLIIFRWTAAYWILFIYRHNLCMRNVHTLHIRERNIVNIRSNYIWLSTNINVDKPLIKELSLTTGVALALWIIGNENHIKKYLIFSHKIPLN